MNDTSSKCPKCGGTVEIATAQGLCPKCLLAAVALPTETGATSHTAMVLPKLEEVAAAFPHLEIVEVIGQGGMGIVFKARQPKLDRLVALKILPLMLAADPAFAERFTREGRVLARLNHPNIVTVHDFGQTGGFFYLLMEFVDGANLRQAMQAGRFTPEQALAVVPKVCEALQYAHNEGILHRDIKPENILLDAKGRVKIADFGIAKLVGEPVAEKNLTGSGARLGTPHYMAPEQVERPSEVDHRADIYSLGVVFYEMLTGELPLGRFAAPSEKSKSDPRLDEVVFSTLQKEPSRRTQSAAEVKTQVENITGTVAIGDLPRASTSPGGNLPMSKASACYLTTPEHLKSLSGQWNLYKARGGLKLDGTNLNFVHDWHGVTIPLRAIRDLSIGHYPWVMKPTRLDFICVTFEENGTLRRLLFTPHESRWMPTWETNGVVAEWFTAIREAVVRVTGRAPTSTPAAQLQIPEPRGWQRAAFAALVMVPVVLFLCISSLALLRGPGPFLPRLLIPLALVAGFGGAMVWIWSRKRTQGKGGSGYHSPGGAFFLLTVMGIGISLGLVFLIFDRTTPRMPQIAPPLINGEVPPVPPIRALGMLHLMGSSTMGNLVVAPMESIVGFPLHDLVVRYSGPALSASQWNLARHKILGPTLAPSPAESNEEGFRPMPVTPLSIWYVDSTNASSVRFQCPTKSVGLQFALETEDEAKEAERQIRRAFPTSKQLGAGARLELFRVGERTAWLEIHPYSLPIGNELAVYPRKQFELGRPPAPVNPTNNPSFAIITLPPQMNLQLVGKRTDLVEGSYRKSPTNLFVKQVNGRADKPSIYWLSWDAHSSRVYLHDATNARELLRFQLDAPPAYQWRESNHSEVEKAVPGEPLAVTIFRNHPAENIVSFSASVEVELTATKSPVQ